jgi:hypothetical protein
VRHGEPFLVRWGKALLKRQVKLFGRSPASAINSDQIRALDPLCQFECSFKRTEKKDFLFLPVSGDFGDRYGPGGHRSG